LILYATIFPAYNGVKVDFPFHFGVHPMPRKHKTESSNNAQPDQGTTFIRRQILKTPTGGGDVFREAWEKAKMKGKAPEDRVLSGMKSGVARGFGISDIGMLPPPRKNGEPNISALLRLYIMNHPGVKLADANEFFTTYGISVNSVAFSTAKKVLAGGGGVEAEGRKKGPRARRLPKRRYKRRELTQEEQDVRQEQTQRLEAAETALDTLIGLAEDIKDSKLVSDLRNSRRRVSAKILALV
jgi:hypothetical protein